MPLRLLCLLALCLALRAEDSVTIWWAQWAPADGLQELGAEYTKETGVKVNVHQIPWSSYQDQVFLNFGNAKTDFDIVVGDSQWLGRGATKGLYVDLTTWLPSVVDLKTIHPTALQYLCEYPVGSQHYWAAPCETDAVGFAYRKDWFSDPANQAAFKAKYGADLGVPKTWDEFQKIAAFFTKPADKHYGCALLTGRGYDSLVMGFQPFLLMYGASWGDPKTYTATGALDSPKAVEALTYFKSLMAYTPNGGTDVDYGKSVEVFSNGSTAMAMNFFAFFPGLAKDMGDKVGFFAMPSINGHRASSLGGQGFSISAKTSAAQQELAKKFIVWFLSQPVQEQWVKKSGGFTANAALLASDEFRNATPYNRPFAESMDILHDFWNVPQYNELLSSTQRLVGEALDGKQSPAEALKAMATEHDEIFEDAGLKK